MQPILTQSVYQPTHLLRGSVEGTTEDLKIRGQEIKNIVINGSRETTDVINSARIQYGISADQVEEGQEYTLFFNITKTELEQGEFTRAFVSIEVPGNGLSTVSGQLFIREGMGKIVKPFRMNAPQGGEPNYDKYKVVFYSDIPSKKITVKDVMLIKGTYHKWIPFFEDVKGFGPDIALISHNKNLLPKIEKGSIDVQSGVDREALPGLNAIRFKEFISVTPKQDFTFSSEVSRIANKPENYDHTILCYDINKRYIGETSGKLETHNSNSVTGTIPPNCHFIKCTIEGNYDIPNDLNELKCQLEEGTKQTEYIKPRYSYKEYKLPYELRKDEYLMYDCEYNKWVIKHRLGQGTDHDHYVTKHLTDIIDPYADTYAGTTWISIVEKDGILKEGSIEFNYPQDPHYAHLGKHLKYLLELKSGEVINSYRYGTAKQEKNVVLFKDGYYGDPDRTVVISEVSRIIYLD